MTTPATHRSTNTDTSPTFDLVAIDLDGTLVDSVADLHTAVNRMQDALSRERTPLDSTRCWIGNGIERLVHRALTGTMHEQAASALFERAMRHFMSAYEQANGQSSVLYPGVLAGLAWLGTLGVPLVCVTNKARRFSVPLLDTLDIAAHFSDHVAGDDVARRKPDPSALLLAASRCGARPSHSVLIGDSISDIGAARGAGFACIGVSYGYNHGHPLRDLDDGQRPDTVIDSFTELPGAFERLASERLASERLATDISTHPDRQRSR